MKPLSSLLRMQRMALSIVALVLLMAAGTTRSAAQTAGEWTWVAGSNTANSPANYGMLGQPSATATPGPRRASSTWTDHSGNLWLFGGEGNDATGNLGFLNDLWQYSPSTQEWTWMGGTSSVGQSGSYGTVGQPGQPGARSFSTAWSDAAGNLWLFGGYGYDGNGAQGFLNDLWRYSIITNQWTWMGGSSLRNQSGTISTLGQPGQPGGRDQATGWTDPSGNLWLFGGQGFDSSASYGYLGDLWEYSPATAQWIWVSGSNLANPLPVGQPGGRLSATGWADAAGNLWLFAGVGETSSGTSDYLDDLWQYSPTSQQWTLVGGSSTREAGVYGTLGQPASGNFPGSHQGAAGWTDSAGNFWLFGGYGIDGASGSGILNDLWRYSPASREWTWMGGSSVANQHGASGMVGQASPSNLPGARGLPVSWTDNTGNFWLFGGYGIDIGSAYGGLNDLWVYQPVVPETPVISPGGSLYHTPQTVTITEATPGTTLYYTTDGSTPSATNGTQIASGSSIVINANTLLQAVATMPGSNNSPVAIANYRMVVRAPQLSLPGGTYRAAQSVTITDPNPAAMLYYTLDNSSPSATNGTLIANGGSVLINQSETLRVIAVESGWTSSGVVYAKYVLGAAAPHLSIAGGTFHNPQAVTVTESSPGVSLYYTLDNSTPSATNGTSIASGGVVNVTQSETLQVVAVANGWTPSGVAKARFTLTASAPHLSLAGGTYRGAQAVTITDPSPGVQLVYTLDGTTPSATNGTAVSSGAVVNITQTETLSVVAMETGWTSSGVVKANYTIK